MPIRLFLLFMSLCLSACKPALLEPDVQASAEGFKQVWVAGAPGGGYADGEAKKSRFGGITDVSFDEVGNLYIADATNHVIRKWDIHTNQVSTVAGSSYDTEAYPQGQFKDGSAEEAKFFFPNSLVYHTANDTIYVTDHFNHRVRQIKQNQVSTLIGSSEENVLPGLKFDAQTLSKTLRKDGSFLEATTMSPRWLKIQDKQNLYLFEDEHKVRILDLKNQTVSSLKDPTYLPDEKGVDFPKLIDAASGSNSSLWVIPLSGIFLITRYELSEHNLQVAEKIGDNEGLLCGGFTNYCWSENQKDGSFQQALFRKPRRLAINQTRSVIFVLDELAENNYTLRRIDLQNQYVSTIGHFKDFIDMFISPQGVFYIIKNEALYRLEPSPAKEEL